MFFYSSKVILTYYLTNNNTNRKKMANKISPVAAKYWNTILIQKVKWVL